MIGELNRQNPYVIQLIENMEPLKHSAIQKSEKFTRNLINGFLVTISTCILCMEMRIILIYGLIFLMYVMVTTLSFKATMEFNPLSEITRIIYGNQYEKIYVNNEALLKLIERVSYFKGALQVFEKVCNYSFILLTISDGVLLLYKWILYFI